MRQGGVVSSLLTRQRWYWRVLELGNSPGDSVFIGFGMALQLMWLGGVARLLWRHPVLTVMWAVIRAQFTGRL